MGSPEKKIHKEGKNWQIKLMRKGRIMRDEKKKKEESTEKEIIGKVELENKLKQYLETLYLYQ